MGKQLRWKRWVDKQGVGSEVKEREEGKEYTNASYGTKPLPGLQLRVGCSQFGAFVFTSWWWSDEGSWYGAQAPALSVDELCRRFRRHEVSEAEQVLVESVKKHLGSQRPY